MATKQVNGKSQNSTARHTKPLNRFSQKIGRRDYVLDGTRYAKFLAIGSGVFVPQIRDFAVLLGWLFFGFFNKATTYAPGRIFTQNTSNDVVPGKEVPFGGLDDYILYLDP